MRVCLTRGRGARALLLFFFYGEAGEGGEVGVGAAGAAGGWGGCGVAWAAGGSKNRRERDGVRKVRGERRVRRGLK